MKITLNPQYAVRNDSTCSFIVVKSFIKDKRITNRNINIVPPFWGYILSFFCGEDYYHTIDKISKKLNIDANIIRNHVDKLINKDAFTSIVVRNETVFFPPFLLVEVDTKIDTDVSSDNRFSPFNVYKKKRPENPFNVNLMITTHCKTNCIYCYADKNNQCEMEFSTILKLVKEMRSIGVVNLTITGGDIFAHKDWKSIINLLYRNHYRSFLSTKIPLDENDIKFLIENDIDELQFSLDSCVPQELSMLISSPKDYLDRVSKMFDFAHQYGLRINIRTVLCKYNSSVESINNSVDFFNKHDSVCDWILTPAFYSSFKNNYDTYKAEEVQLNNVYKLLSSIKTKYPIHVNNIKNKLQNSQDKFFENCSDFIKNNKTCNAGSYLMSIIVSGKVSICEMLYDNFHCIIGDIHSQSIHDIWSSKVALKTYCTPQKEMIHKEGNPCYTCELYMECKGGNNKKICFSDIIKAYGKDNYDYPDPRCPKAPKFDHDKINY